MDTTRRRVDITLIVGLILWAVVVFTAIYHPWLWAVIAGVVIVWALFSLRR